MDTPKIPGPRDEGERQVLEKLMAIRDQLQLRKLDRTTYVRTQDVMVLYNQTIEQVRILSEIRNGKPVEENQGTVTLNNQPRHPQPSDSLSRAILANPLYSGQNSRQRLPAALALLHDNRPQQ